MKICRKCNEQKMKSDFGPDKRASDKLQSRCRACSKLDKAEWAAANPEKVLAARAATYKRHKNKILAKNAAWRAENKELVAAGAAAWAERNKDQIRARRVAFRIENRDVLNARTAKWKRENKDRARQSVSAWRLAHPEKVRGYQAKYRANNPDAVQAARNRWSQAHPENARVVQQNRMARKRASGGKISRGIVAKLMRLQKGRCACCGKLLGKGYNLDHHMPLARGGPHIDANLQLLRAACNLEKSARHPVEFMQSRGFLI
ncbi:HNH endonuclease [Massilia antarctica]|uniref:HNH endonuclease n=1 Tax=Massilia antarctica TaxID=2765360 RepID=UPI00226ED469|nr:HNH endonuclease [Massilia sp. H27-R4]MCY0910901.1 HNH endonuclease [Massilia sp. H27-R4]